MVTEKLLTGFYFYLLNKIKYVYFLVFAIKRPIAIENSMSFSSWWLIPRFKNSFTIDFNCSCLSRVFERLPGTQHLLLINSIYRSTCPTLNRFTNDICWATFSQNLKPSLSLEFKPSLRFVVDTSSSSTRTSSKWTHLKYKLSRSFNTSQKQKWILSQRSGKTGARPEHTFAYGILRFC